MKPLECVVFGYAIVFMFLSSVLPASAPLLLTVSFFTPYLERRSRLTLALFLSGCSIIMALIQKDAARPFLLGLDMFVLSALAALALPSLLLNLDLMEIAEGTPEPILVATGAAALFMMSTIMLIMEFRLIAAILRITGFYRRVGRIYPRWRP